ncbi:HAD-IIB family hydrolase [Marinobacterium lutimaris]|uniref:Mannosyl-3-phosphoglycerate phosphatase n=1 Tax=Marinobacterium lutimaris TaxID=568106 RepID=A0A1H5TFD2_9GAMM|nr:HAD-IIB family hydrolase [Marinobacterium lutimaris]SEF60801.1 mannosyl-3-phosphoglycerate phosphatase [Marinobacterium lutimaris]
MTETIQITTPPPLLIVTDLDGTLLDHHTYSFEAARPALERCRAAAIPVVPNTSKTRAELIALRRQLDSSDPFIIENGSAICIPEQQIHLHADQASYDEGFVELPLGVPIDEVHKTLAPLRKDFQFEAFGDWSTEQILANTGLTAEEALAASQRRYSEALLWKDSDEKKREFIELLRQQGLHALQGGRFLSVLGAEADKGAALERLKQLYRPVLGDTPTVIALGDSHNDEAMLNAADIAVIIANPSGRTPQVEGPEVIYSKAAGPAGWNEVIQTLLDRFDVE